MSPKAVIFYRVLGVLALLFIIAAVLFPVFAKGKVHNWHWSCASNEKQLGLALIQYVQDNDEMMPNTENGSAGNTWRAAIYPYAKSPGLFQCPDHDSDDHVTNPPSADGYAPNYAANDNALGAFARPGAKPVAVADVPQPKKLIVLMETAYNPDPGYDIDDATQFGPSTRKFWAGHNGQSLYLFFDGHVKPMTPTDTYQTFRPDKVAVNYWYRDNKRPLSANGVAVLQDAETRFPQNENP